MLTIGCPSLVNKNSEWLHSRGLWLTYTVGVLLLHLVILSLPFLTTAWCWTLTNLIHNLFMFIFLHLLKGSPWDSGDQGKINELTHWEQIDDEIQFTVIRKFLIIFPIILFFLTSLTLRLIKLFKRFL